MLPHMRFILALAALAVLATAVESSPLSIVLPELQATHVLPASEIKDFMASPFSRGLAKALSKTSHLEHESHLEYVKALKHAELDTLYAAGRFMRHENTKKKALIKRLQLQLSQLEKADEGALLSAK